jgi:hypothetical protein
VLSIFFLSFFFLIVMLGGGTLPHLQKFLQCMKYIILEFTPSNTFLYPSSLHSQNTFNRLSLCWVFLRFWTICLGLASNQDPLPLPPE